MFLAYDEQKMLTEYDMMGESSEDEETDPPPPSKYLQQMQQETLQAPSLVRKQEPSDASTGAGIDQKPIISATTVKKLSVAYSSTSSSSNKASPSPDHSKSMLKPLATPSEALPSTTTATPALKKQLQEKVEDVKEAIRPVREAPSKPIQALRRSISSSESSDGSSDEEELGSAPVLKPIIVQPEVKPRKVSIDSSTPSAQPKPAKPTTLDFNEIFTNEVDSDLRERGVTFSLFNFARNLVGEEESATSQNINLDSGRSPGLNLHHQSKSTCSPLTES